MQILLFTYVFLYIRNSTENAVFSRMLDSVVLQVSIRESFYNIYRKYQFKDVNTAGFHGTPDKQCLAKSIGANNN